MHPTLLFFPENIFKKPQFTAITIAVHALISLRRSDPWEMCNQARNNVWIVQDFNDVRRILLKYLEMQLSSYAYHWWLQLPFLQAALAASRHITPTEYCSHSDGNISSNHKCNSGDCIAHGYS